MSSKLVVNVRKNEKWGEHISWILGSIFLFMLILSLFTTLDTVSPAKEVRGLVTLASYTLFLNGGFFLIQAAYRVESTGNYFFVKFFSSYRWLKSLNQARKPFFALFISLSFLILIDRAVKIDEFFYYENLKQPLLQIGYLSLLFFPLFSTTLVALHYWNSRFVQKRSNVEKLIKKEIILAYAFIATGFMIAPYGMGGEMIMNLVPGHPLLSSVIVGSLILLMLYILCFRLYTPSDKMCASELRGGWRHHPRLRARQRP